jgi:hypothetical protein
MPAHQGHFSDAGPVSVFAGALAYAEGAAG